MLIIEKKHTLTDQLKGRRLSLWLSCLVSMYLSIYHLWTPFSQDPVLLSLMFPRLRLRTNCNMRTHDHNTEDIVDLFFWGFS